MPIQIDVAAFPTFAQARAFLLLRDEDTKGDQLLADILNGVGHYFEQQTGRRLKRRSYVNQLVNGSGWTNLFLPEYPVVSISSIRASFDRAFDGATELVVFDGTSTAHDVVLVDEGASGELALVNGDIWPDGPSTVRVSYVAGYLPSEHDEIVQAQLVMVADYWNLIGRDPSVQSFSMSGLSKQFAGGVTDKYPNHAKVAAILSSLKRASFET